MGVFGNANQPEMGYAKQIGERCRPDYETQILRLKASLAKSDLLRAALYEYISDDHMLGNGGPMTSAEIIGRLELEHRYITKAIEETIARQEADKD